jgi:hypothetical protein
MRAYVQLSGVMFALVAIMHLVRVLARWPLLIAGYPLPAVASLVVLLVTAGMSVWAWRLLTAPRAGEAARRPPGT